MNSIAIIPARGGSKRIPRKNIKEFCGKPMIAWSIETALQSGLFEKVVVSTDDEEIAEVAQSYGATAPFQRPEHLANDHAATLPVVRHAVEWHLNQGFDLDAVCCIYPTAPFLQAQYLKESLELLRQDEEVDFCFAATSFESSIFRALKIDTQNNVSMFWPENETKRSQDFPEAYHDAGQFYWGRAQAWLEKESLFSSNSKVVVLPSHLVQDIDYPNDWLQAELKFKALGDVEKL